MAKEKNTKRSRESSHVVIWAEDRFVRPEGAITTNETA